jgi:c-di-GMP-binding flagellar brake protein YcgR
MIEEEDPFTVTSPLEIKSLLKSVQRRKALVRMHIKGTEASIVTTILHVDADSSSLLVDTASDSEFNQRVLRSPTIMFDTMVDGVKIQFQAGGITTATYDKLPALRVPLPETLLRIQRRDSYRVEVPMSLQTTCRFSLPNGKPGPVMRIRDISAGGISVIGAENELEAEMGSFFDPCELSLPEVGAVPVVLRLVRITEDTLPNGKKQQILGMKFFDISRPAQFKVQQFITILERKQNARRRGFE